MARSPAGDDQVVLRLGTGRGRRGHSLAELLVVVGIFSALMAVVALLFSSSVSLYRRTNSADSAMRELRKARAALERDLVLASPTVVRRTQVPSSLGAGMDGEALWFLSPVDPATGATIRRPNGRLCWQRNILYYLVVPDNHDATFGMTCVGGAAANGYDDRCPHKVLIRKVIDSGAPTVALDLSTEEALLPSVAGYLSRPVGFDLSAMADPAPTQRSIVASHLLTFETFTAPAPKSLPTEVLVDLRALAAEDARREMRVGADPAYDCRFTRQGPFSVFLRN